MIDFLPGDLKRASDDAIAMLVRLRQLSRSDAEWEVLDFINMKESWTNTQQQEEAKSQPRYWWTVHEGGPNLKD